MSGRLEEFCPQHPGRVTMYTCGPTVWNYAHVGNYRAFLFYDLLRRHLRSSGYRVTQVMNLTDVDDRIIQQASQAGVSIQQFTGRYEEAFFEDLRSLRSEAAEHYPRATEHVDDMVALIGRLLAGGHAYLTEDGVYFRVATFPAYGALSHLDRSGLRAGARVATDKYDKESASDFALWKPASPEDELVGAAWDSPFGRGRPGWHIECSAMAMRYLGETLDIHAGGVDLLFPHHENEIAQSEAASGRPFSRFWLHSEFVADATGAKMSKSAGNFATLRDLTAAGHDALAVRMFLLAGAHYRSKLRLTDKALGDAAEQVRRLRDFAYRVERLQPAAVEDQRLVQQVADVRRHYRAALDEDLNLAQATGHLFDLVREANAAMDGGRVGPASREELRRLLSEADAHLDVLHGGESELDSEEVEMINHREEARGRRDFATADRIREELRRRGIALEDAAQGVRWRRIRP